MTAPLYWIVILGLVGTTFATLIGMDAYSGRILDINPLTAATTQLNLARPTNFDTHSNPAIDEKNGIYYVVGLFYGIPHEEMALLSYSTKNWRMLSKVSLPMFAADEYPVPHPNTMGCEVHPVTGDVYISGYFDTTKRVHGVVKVSKSGTVTSLGSFDEFTDDYDRDTISVLDHKNDLLILKLFQHTTSYHVSFDLKTGKVVTREPAKQGTLEFATMVYDYESGTVYGIGSYDNEVSLLKMDSTTLKLELVKELDGYKYLSFTNAIDHKKRQILTYLYRENSGYELVQVELDGTIAHKVRACSAGACPFSLAFFNQ